ncbi:hypothetical protein [Hyphomonas sp.]|uniref:hypothetical protein n=1 Tax=Hyphomonas sp. TaxID=87 RepID=UPI00262FF581|nr:hypothetical protein [Hyphomonas sp.]MDF1807995.1 hypothetical protein [Hyphomonas sp.]
MDEDTVQLNIRTSRQFRTLLKLLSDHQGISMNRMFEYSVREYADARMRIDPEFRKTFEPFYEACQGECAR